MDVLGLRPGYPEQRTHDYKRNGRTDLLAARNIVTGHIFARCYDRHHTVEFLDSLNELEKTLPADVDIYLIMNNSTVHTSADAKKWFAARPRWGFQFTPRSASWINQIERWFARLSRRVLKRGVFRSVAELVEAIYRFIEHYNGNPRPYEWRKEVDEVLASIERYHQQVAWFNRKRLVIHHTGRMGCC